MTLKFSLFLYEILVYRLRCCCRNTDIKRLKGTIRFFKYLINILHPNLKIIIRRLNAIHKNVINRKFTTG